MADGEQPHIAARKEEQEGSRQHQVSSGLDDEHMYTLGRTDLKFRLRRIEASGRTSGMSAWRICGRDEGIPGEWVGLDARRWAIHTCCVSLGILASRLERDSRCRPRPTSEFTALPLAITFCAVARLARPSLATELSRARLRPFLPRLQSPQPLLALA